MTKILIADDVPGWIRFHKNNIEYLKLDDVQIDTASSAYDALSKIELELDSPYDVVFTDMQMEPNFLPKLAGEWLIEQIQMLKEYEKTKIVIISASPEISMIAKKYGVEYLSKYVARNSNAEVYRNFLK